MTIQPPRPFAPVADAHPIGAALLMAENDDGGHVFHCGHLHWAWDAGDDAMRRMVAVKLWDMKAAAVAEIAAGFGVTEDTLWRWHRTLDGEGFTALASSKHGTKGGSKLTTEVIARIHALKKTKLAKTRIAAQIGVSEFSVRYALTLTPASGDTPEPETGNSIEAILPAVTAAPRKIAHPQGIPAQEELPLLPAAVDRATERMAASFGELTELTPVLPRPPAFP